MEAPRDKAAGNPRQHRCRSYTLRFVDMGKNITFEGILGNIFHRSCSVMRHFLSTLENRFPFLHKGSQCLNAVFSGNSYLIGLGLQR